MCGEDVWECDCEDAWMKLDRKNNIIGGLEDIELGSNRPVEGKHNASTFSASTRAGTLWIFQAMDVQLHLMRFKQIGAKFKNDYFINRPTLVSVFLLIGASIRAKKIDLEYASWLGQKQIPMTFVFTKCDKQKRKKNGGKWQKRMQRIFRN